MAEYRIWTHLARRDLRVRYAQNRFGPWLSTLALVALLTGTSIAVSVLGGVGIRVGLSQLAVSLTIWLFFSAVLIESAEIPESERSLMLNTRLSLLHFVLRVIWRNILIGLHNWSIVIALCIALDHRTGFRTLLLPIALMISSGIVIGPAFALARLCFRQREISKFVPAVVQIAFFVTPILWADPGTGLGNVSVNLNPLAWPILVARDFISNGQLSAFLLASCIAATGVSLLVLWAAMNGSEKDKLWI